MSLAPPPTTRTSARVLASCVPPTLAHLDGGRRARSGALGFAAPGVETGWCELGSDGPRVRLMFPTASALVATLQRAAVRPALPLGNPRALVLVREVSRRGSALMTLTAPEGGLREADPTHGVQLLLIHLLPRALAALATHDAPSTALLLPHAPFVFGLGVRGEPGAAVHLDASGRATHTTRPADRRPSAALVFNSMRAAAAVLAEREVELAAVTGGDITVRGRVPLADAMGRVMQRAARVLRGQVP